MSYTLKIFILKFYIANCFVSILNIYKLNCYYLRFHIISRFTRSKVNYTDYYCVYQVLDNRVVGKKYTYLVESHNSWCRSHLARLARDTKAVTRSMRMTEYSLALLNVIYPHIFSRGRTPLNEAYLKGVQYIRENLIEFYY
ncbi:Partial transposase in ISC1173 [Saccharolobus solfataricus P2]|uniref:Partial transposase in ISC1173 n=3 Tax=Saccharolobus solfataricus TaxID=2287 RepID=Q97VG7_SACS2|nr:Partial transposase in ISC1173 [Saccharolobus solfataricus P2]SAI86336.1 partial transposase in ISC1173 [Saccharolobus solfataricus]